MSAHRRQISIEPYEYEQPAHAKIVATIGPASESEEMIARLIRAGVSVFRFNFSHGNFEQHQKRFDTVRKVAGEANLPIACMGDLQGPKIRVRAVPDVHEGGGIMLETGQDVLFSAEQDAADPTGGPDGIPVFGTTFLPIFNDVLEGQRVLVNDGAIRMLAVDRKPGEWLRCRVTHGGRVTSNKGINLPESDLKSPAITERDWECVNWAVRLQMDYLALSFVRRADEVVELRERLAELCRNPDGSYGPLVAGGFGPGIPVVPKIEKPQAVKNIEEIVKVSDAVMVARGDLGVEMDLAQVPVAQKHIIAVAENYGIPSIVATQMLESMIDAPAPTRAEASDVANAVFDGADCVMLSGETAVGKHPDLVVETMRRIIQAAERRIAELPQNPSLAANLPEFPYRSAALAVGAWHVAMHADAKLVVVWSEAGGMARYLSQHEFRVPIIAYTTREVAARRMAMFGGVTPVVRNPPESGSLAEWTGDVERRILERSWASEGDAVILIAGKPLGGTIAQDILSILRLGDPHSGFRGSEDRPSIPAYGLAADFARAQF